MAEVDEQRVCIKFCERLSKTGSEPFEMLKQAFGDSCMSCSQTFEWFGRFKNGRTSTAKDDRSGRPSTATTPLFIVHFICIINLLITCMSFAALLISAVVLYLYMCIQQ